MESCDTSTWWVRATLPTLYVTHREKTNSADASRSLLQMTKHMTWSYFRKLSKGNGVGLSPSDVLETLFHCNTERVLELLFFFLTGNVRYTRARGKPVVSQPHNTVFFAVASKWLANHTTTKSDSIQSKHCPHVVKIWFGWDLGPIADSGLETAHWSGVCCNTNRSCRTKS